MLDALRQPLFMAYHNNQPFNNNHLRRAQCSKSRKTTAADGTRNQRKINRPPVPGNCRTPFAENANITLKEWKTKADELWGEIIKVRAEQAPHTVTVLALMFHINCLNPSSTNSSYFFCDSASCIFIARTFRGSPNRLMNPSAS